MHSAEEIETTRHEYRLSTFGRLRYLGLAAILLIGSGFFFKLAVHPIGREFALVVGILFLIPGLILVTTSFRSRLILDVNYIELRSPFRTHSANRDDIEGLRTVKNQYGRWTRICLKHDRGAFNVSDSFIGNTELNTWLKGLPDLDEGDAAQISRQIQSDDSLGATENQRLNILKRAKTWIVVLSVAELLFTVLALMNYAPLHNVSMIFLAILPLLGMLLVHRFPLLFTLFKSKNDPRSDVGLIVLCPGVGMLLSYQFGSDPGHLVDFFQLNYWILFALVCFVGAFFRIAWSNSSRWGAFVGLVLFGAMYSIGLMNTANSVPDRSTPGHFRSEIMRKYETHGKNANSYLRLAPWGPMVYYDDVAIPKSMYEELNIGDQVCIALHGGFLHAPWYTVAACPERSASPMP